jgi:flagellar motility protein MotE (MotC chaperone)
MKSGYDQFFKKARENAQTSSPAKKGGKPRFQMQDRRHTISSSSQPLNVKPATNAELANELRRRVQAAKKPKRRSKISWKLAGASFLGLVITAGGMFGHDKIESFVKRIEISVIGSAIAEEKPAAPAPEKKAEGEAKKEAAAEAPVKKEFSEEEISHFSKLNERKRELDAREEELNRMEAELQAQKAELEKRLVGLEKTRRDISSVLEERVKTDDTKVETLVQMYSNMKPQQAAKIFEEMDEDLAVEIIGRMKKKNAAEIMNLIKPEKAKVFAEKFAGYKRS